MTGHSYKNVKKTCRILCSDFPSFWKIWRFFGACYRQKMSLPVPFYEFARTFLPVCYVQTTRKVPPFSTKNKGKNGAFQSFPPLFTRAFSSLQEITL